MKLVFLFFCKTAIHSFIHSSSFEQEDILIMERSSDPKESHSEQEQLMLRLQHQFGDLDLANLIGDEKKTDDDEEAQSEESSLAEPSAEELRAWQEAQFQRGQKALEKKKHEETRSAIQRRREELKELQRRKTDGLLSEDDTVDDDDWEQIAAAPDLKGQPSIFFPSETKGGQLLGAHPLLEELVAEGSEPDILGTSWKLLYSSAEGDGLSFVKLLDNIRGYPGPTVLLLGAVSASSKETVESSQQRHSSTNIGFFSTSGWVESSSMTGNSDCFLFAFNERSEKIHFFNPKEQKGETTPHYMYCHPSSLKASNLRRGIGIGGSASQPRLHLTENLEDCRAMDYCHLFEDGDLLLGQAKHTLNYFDVDCIEAWAVGGDEWINESLEAQRSQREIQQANIMKARTVKDKKQLLHDFTGGLLSTKSSGLFAHAPYAADRCDM